MTAIKGHQSGSSPNSNFPPSESEIHHQQNVLSSSEAFGTFVVHDQPSGPPDHGSSCDRAKIGGLESVSPRNEDPEDIEPGLTSDICHMDCPVENMDATLGTCSCASIVLRPHLRDRAQNQTISEALRLWRRNHGLEITGQWLFASDTFNKWRDMSRSSTLWLVASPGMGKSMLCSAVLDMLETNRRFGDIVTFFFCDGRFTTCERILVVLSNMVHELVSRNIDPQSQDRLNALAIDLANTGNKLSVSNLKSFLSIIQHSLRTFETFFLILDGFDDTTNCESDHELLHTFLDFSNSHNTRHQIKIFISSRPNFDPCRSLGGVLRVDMNREKLARVDVDTFVRKGVQNLQLSNPSPNRDALMERLKSNPNETFLSAALTLRNWWKDCTVLDDSVDLHASAVSLLSGIYNGMLNRILEKDTATNLLRWVVYSARPLSLEEIGYAVSATSQFSERDVWRLSGGLLSTGKSQTVNFVHLTARDHVLSLSERNTHWMGKPSMAHEMITRTCLKALSPIELLQCMDLLNLDRYRSSVPHQRINFAYARRYLIFHYMLGEPQSNSLPGLLHSSLKKSMESQDFRMYAALRQFQPTTACSCGSSASHCMMSRMILEAAADFGLEKLARLELQMGGNAHLACKHDSRAALQPLHLAARGGHLNVVKLLLEYGADLTAISTSGRTPLFYAAAKGSSDIIRLLLSHAALTPSAPLTDSQSSLRSCSSKREFQHVCEPLYLVARFSQTCALCNDNQPHYVISKPPKDHEDGSHWPPIHVMGEPISAEEDCPSPPLWSSSSRSFSFDGEERQEGAIIKWFAGADMYNALEIAARRGVGTVKDLLLAADNDKNLVNRLISVRELVSNLRIS